MSRRDSSEERLERFHEAWERFFRAVRRARARVPEDRPRGLTLSQYLLLHPLQTRSPQAVRELADAAGIAGPTASRLLDGLEAAGFVERRHSERDRRSVEVHLTAAGRRELTDTREWVNEGRRQIYDALEPAERAEAERLLARLADVVERLDAERG
jgi:DNA-binding MarR family transcriptional regulator